MTAIPITPSVTTMQTLLQALTDTVAAMSPLQLTEAAAVTFAIAYLILAVREHIACWYAAALSTLLYLVVFWQVGLLMESMLQCYYLAMAGYGWWHWRHGSKTGSTLPITTWPLRNHLAALVAVIALSAASGYLLTEFTAAQLPYIDAFTTWASIVATWMVARKLLENWACWLIIDSISIGLYLDRGLHLTALLFAFYLVIVVIGWRRWWLQYRQQHMGDTSDIASNIPSDIPSNTGER